MAPRRPATDLADQNGVLTSLETNLAPSADTELLPELFGNGDLTIFVDSHGQNLASNTSDLTGKWR